MPSVSPQMLDKLKKLKITKAPGVDLNSTGFSRMLIEL